MENKNKNYIGVKSGKSADGQTVREKKIRILQFRYFGHVISYLKEWYWKKRKRKFRRKWEEDNIKEWLGTRVTKAGKMAANREQYRMFLWEAPSQKICWCWVDWGPLLHISVSGRACLTRLYQFLWEICRFCWGVFSLSFWCISFTRQATPPIKFIRSRWRTTSPMKPPPLFIFSGHVIWLFRVNLFLLTTHSTALQAANCKITHLSLPLWLFMWKKIEDGIKYDALH